MPHYLLILEERLKSFNKIYKKEYMKYILYSLILIICANINAMDVEINNRSDDQDDLVTSGLQLLTEFNKDRHYSKRVILSDSDQEMEDVSLLVQEYDNDNDTLPIVSKASWLKKNKKYLTHAGFTMSRFIWYSSVIRVALAKLFSNIDMTSSPTNVVLSSLGTLFLSVYPFFTETVTTQVLNSHVTCKCNRQMVLIYLITASLGIGIGTGLVSLFS